LTNTMNDSFLPEIAPTAFAPSSATQLVAPSPPEADAKPMHRRARIVPTPAAAEAIRKQRSAIQRHKQRPQIIFWEPLKDGATRVRVPPITPPTLRYMRYMMTARLNLLVITPLAQLFDVARVVLV